MIDDQDVERQHGGQLFTQLDQLYRQVYVEMGKRIYVPRLHVHTKEALALW